MLTNCKVQYGKSNVTSKCVAQLTSMPGPALMQESEGGTVESCVCTAHMETIMGAAPVGAALASECSVTGTAMGSVYTRRHTTPQREIKQS